MQLAKKNLLHTRNIVLLCIMMLVLPFVGRAQESRVQEELAQGGQVQAEQSKNTNAPESEHKVQVTHITPDYLDETEVYPARHVVVELDPFKTYAWEYIEFPEEWLGDDYYFELWGANNKPLPGFGATKLHQHMNNVVDNTIPLDGLDASLYPAVRLILFAREGAEPIPARQHAIHAYYTEAPNTRLFVFAGMLAVIITAIAIGIAYTKVSLSKTLMESLPLISGRTVQEGTSLHKFLRYVVLTVLWSSVFGAVLGLYVGGIQVLYLLIKLPFLLIVTFVFSFLSIAVISMLLGLQASTRELGVQALRVLAGFSISMASLAPLVLFYIIIGYDHDQLLSAFMFIVAVSGAMAAFQMWLWIRTRAPGIRGLAVSLVWLAFYGVVLMQFGWMLRPWVGATDPIHDSVPFARLYSGNVFEEIGNTLNRL